MSKREFELDISATTGAEHIGFLRKNLRAAHGLLKSRLEELSVALVGDVRMSALHKHYLGEEGPTDVLSFELEHDRRGRPISGEVVACVAEARRQAKRHGVSLRNELLLYTLHGMLHLSGYDDLTEAGYRKMHQTEDRILKALGVGAVFEPEARPGRRAGNRQGGRS